MIFVFIIGSLSWSSFQQRDGYSNLLAWYWTWRWHKEYKSSWNIKQSCPNDHGPFARNITFFWSKENKKKSVYCLLLRGNIIPISRECKSWGIILSFIKYCCRDTENAQCVAELTQKISNLEFKVKKIQ